MNNTVLRKIGSLIVGACENKKSASVICLFLGVASAIPYYCEQLFIFTFISLFALFYVVIKQNKHQKRYFSPFFCYFIGFYTPLYLFLSELYPYERFGFSGTQAMFVVICSCVFIPLIHALVEASILWVSRFFPDNGFSVLGYAALWVVGEWVLTLGTLAFPWGNIAVSLTGFLPYLQTASLFGRSFITFVTVSGCYALALSAADKKRLFALIGAAVIGFNGIAGTILWFIPSETAQTVRVAALQGNISSNEKWVSGQQESIFERYVALAEDAAENGAEIILLPESAIPVSFNENGYLHRAFAEIAAEYDTTIVAGVSCQEGTSFYNSVIAVYPDSSLSERYDKRHLVPFGEFMPFADILGELIPFVGEFNESSGDYAEGDSSVVIETVHGDITPLVCFDSIFPQFASDGCKDGAEMIAIVTNDSWFYDSAGVYTHLRHAQLRAIENKRYVMRAANTGVSAFIDEKGKITAESEPLVVDTIYAEIHGIQGNTLYTLVGDAVLYVSFVIVIALTTYSFIRRAKNGKDSASQN